MGLRDAATFTVTGRGDFPFDMLRHDRCYPATGEDAAKLERPDSPTQRAIRLVACTVAEITPDRWASFGWRVHDIDEDGSRYGSRAWVVRQEANGRWSAYEGMGFRKGGFKTEAEAREWMNSYRAEVGA